MLVNRKLFFSITAFPFFILSGSAMSMDEFNDTLATQEAGKETPTTVCEDCGKTHQLAVTNGRIATIYAPKNVGGDDACTLTLQCLDAGNKVVDTSKKLGPGERLPLGFTCNEKARKIAMKCDLGSECKLQYTKYTVSRGSASLEDFPSEEDADFDIDGQDLSGGFSEVPRQ